MKSLIESTQQLGRALMLPIAVLPVAGLLLRLGQPDLMNLAPVAAAGDAIFSNLGILFAIGVAVGLARENHGAAGLAAVVGFLVATKGAEVLIQVPPDLLVAIGVQNDRYGFQFRQQLWRPFVQVFETVRLQGELVTLQDWVIATGHKVVILFEGRDRLFQPGYLLDFFYLGDQKLRALQTILPPRS